MKDALLAIIIHAIVVCLALGVAVLAWKLIGSDSELVLGAFAVAMIVLEKAARALPFIPIKDFVNQR